MTPLDKRLLILDDDITVARTIGFVAEGMGFFVRCVDAPQAFFDAVASMAPSHIAIDLIMPGMDGVEVMRQLALADCQAQVILTSGMGQKVLESAQSTASERGLNILGVLPKPFRSATLRDLLSRDVIPPRKPRLAVATEHVAMVVPPALLEAAIAERRITIVAQPKIELASGRVVGAEILARWKDQELGFVPPDAFVAVAETTGMMRALTMLVLDQSLEWFADSPLRAIGGSIAVNLSTSCLSDVLLADQIQEHCEACGVPAGSLILEITESTAMDRTADTFDTLTRLRLKGFRLSLDDFGTGYSSLAQLARLPLSEIKIDRSFVARLQTSDVSHKIVDATIRLAKGMDLVCVAEGVEDEHVARMLTDMGCALAQGYLFSRPLLVDQFDDWQRARG
ncbi:EAL domain-containing response regulator [Thermomonas carbonis]|uniref:EAL domain-containing response regulator n=1 Tax=Thermomonas carbonis TaxID=1463158 RepID=A0A7G9SN67_9GAMM|nr:EAL domain-containing response regulator [Thermomonas carbonis]QNN69292.1 EAL domain-containing response regulator [Thermomonas carbonis]GHC05441.1 diguanylate phosphodiesterase [Thermomonas carbonis]